MKAIAVSEHFFQDVSDIFRLISTFVLFDEKCIFINSAAVKPKRDLEFSAQNMDIFDVLHANRLTTDSVVSYCNHDKIDVFSAAFFKYKFSELRYIHVPLKVICGNLNRIGETCLYWKTEVFETKARLEQIPFCCIKEAIAQDPFFLRRFSFESLERIEKQMFTGSPLRHNISVRSQMLVIVYHCGLSVLQ